MMATAWTRACRSTGGQLDHPIFSTIYNVEPLAQIPSMNSWLRSSESGESGPSTDFKTQFGDEDPSGFSQQFLSFTRLTSGVLLRF